MKFTKRIIIWVGISLLWFQIGECSVRKDSWTPVIVSEASLQDPAVKTSEIDSPSDITCSISATNSRWAKLFCFEDHCCRLYDLLAVSTWNESLISDPVNCMTSSTGCVVSQKLYALNESLDDDSIPGCPVCQKGNIIEIVDSPPPKQTFSICESPFKTTSSGCIGLFDDGGDYCTAVEKCNEKGGFLANLENMVTNNDLLTLATELGATLTSTYVGVQMKETNFYYVMSGNLFKDQLWKASPAFSNKCAIVYSHNRYGFYPKDCNEFMATYLCERKIV